MELSPEIIKECEKHAMGLVLSSWGNLTYQEVLDSLEQDGQNYPSNDQIVVWVVHDDKWADFILSEIESNYAMLVGFAKYVGEKLWK